MCSNGEVILTGKTELLGGKKFSQCLFVHYESQIDGPMIELRPLRHETFNYVAYSVEQVPT